MFLLPPRIRKLLKGRDSRVFSQVAETMEVDVFPADAAARQRWFSLSIREREVAALACMGYRNYEIAERLNVGYRTVQTHLQNIFRKFHLRSRGEIRIALKSWPAEEWWKAHHY
jgi:DNA-binding CsgD family transcriptional regulator